MNILTSLKNFGGITVWLPPRTWWEGKWAERQCPFSYVLEEEPQRWRGFRRSLKKEEQEAFGRLFNRAKFHTHAAVYMAHAWPLETILVSIFLEHEKMLREILGELKERNT